MKCGILSFEQYQGKRKNWAGSSRIRGEWLIKHWKDAELFKHGEEYGCVIYQKSYWIEHAKNFKGIKILDICDPDWYYWGYQVVEMINEVDAVVTSTEELKNTISKFTTKPVLCIPDRMDLDFHSCKKFHQGRAKNVVWFGYSTGFEMIKPVLHFLKKFELGLIVISDSSFSLPSSFIEHIELRNIPWTLETVNNDIIQGDIVINPKMKKGKWKYKSNNKTLTAWALGMPVADNVEDLEKFLDPEERQKEVKLRLEEVKEKWDVKLSVLDYQNLIRELESNRNK